VAALRGSRVGSSAYGRAGRLPSGRHGGAVDSRLVTFWCCAGHSTTVRLSADIEIPQRWPCGKCPEAAGPDADQPPARAVPSPANGGRTPLEYLQMRRSPEEGERVLAEALDRLRASREGR
jgi:hypothetical protein